MCRSKYDVGDFVNYGEDTVYIVDKYFHDGQWFYSIDYADEIITVEENELEMEVM